jgi:hypothetical protein
VSGKALKLNEAALLVSWIEAETTRMGVVDSKVARVKIIDGSATAAGMNRLLDGKAKDTVKRG